MRLLVLFLLLLICPSRAEAKGCREVSDTVGYTQCSRYGASWSTEARIPVLFGMSFYGGQYAVDGREFEGKFTKKGPILYRYDGRQLGVPWIGGLGLDFRMGGYFTPWFYTTFEWGMALGSADTRSYDSDGYRLSDKGGIDTFIFHGGFVPGVRAPLGRIALRFEVLLGLHAASIAQRAVRPGEDKSGSASDVQGLFMPRAAVDLWVTPWTTFSVFGGMNPWNTIDRQAGITFTWHLRAFDGQFSL
jgi:hypothetical protein